MVYGVILASGVGKRMGIDIPKQYVEIDGKPIIVYTIISMLRVERIDKIYIAVSEEYVKYMNDILQNILNRSRLEKCILSKAGRKGLILLIMLQQLLLRNKWYKKMM